MLAVKVKNTTLLGWEGQRKNIYHQGKLNIETTIKKLTVLQNKVKGYLRGEKKKKGHKRACKTTSVSMYLLLHVNHFLYLKAFAISSQDLEGTLFGVI